MVWRQNQICNHTQQYLHLNCSNGVKLLTCTHLLRAKRVGLTTTMHTLWLQLRLAKQIGMLNKNFRHNECQFLCKIIQYYFIHAIHIVYLCLFSMIYLFAKLQINPRSNFPLTLRSNQHPYLKVKLNFIS